MSRIIKIDLDNPEHTIIINPGAVARITKITPQYAWRVLRQKQPGIKIKEQLIKKFGSYRAA